ncbi:MAG: RHS repeat-associated core domain-containing protein [Terriglobales bacterium]
MLSFTNDKDSNRSVTYGYDSLNRITSAATPNTDCSLVTGTSLTKNWGESFTIDAWGNLTGKTVTKCSAENLSVGPATLQNQLPTGSGFGYDAAGDMTSNGSATYTYNGEGQLKTTAGVTYTYDGDGNRVEKSSGTLYWGTGMLESDGSGNLQREFIFAGGKRIARRDLSGGAVYYYFTDDLGSSSVVTNSTGVIQNESDYYPYGGERAYTLTLANQNYKFTGKERDAESGLDNFGARYDSSTLGRFMTPDWAARPTTVPYAVFGDPQSLNLYGYVRNDPVSRVDADGHQGSYTPGDDLAEAFDNTNIEERSGPPTCTDGRSAAPAPADPPGAQYAAGNSPFLQYVQAEAAGTVEYGKEVLDALGVLPYVGPLFGAGSAAVSASQGNTGEAATTAALSAIPAGGDLSAGSHALGLAAKEGAVVSVYAIVKDGETVYVGITNNLARRAAEHGEELTKIAGGLTRGEARGVEQALINQHGLAKNGGTLLNKINSVAPSNPIYKEAVQFGRQLLQSIGYLL